MALMTITKLTKHLNISYAAQNVA